MAVDQDPAEPPDAAAARLDAQRRHLYRAGATDADLQRYLADRDARDEESPMRTTREEGHGARTRSWFTGRRRGVLLAVVAAVAIVLVVQVERPTEPVRSSASRGPSRVLQDVGSGQVLAVDRSAVSAPRAVPASVDGTSVVGQRFTGRGNAVVAFDPPSDAFDGGRVTVAVTTSGAASVDWRALRVVTRSDWTSYPVVVATGGTGDAAGTAATTFAYPSRPPTRIAVSAPAGARWSLVVAVAGKADAGLH